MSNFVKPNTYEKNIEKIIAPKTVIKKSFSKLVRLILRQYKAIPKKKKGITKAPRPNKSERRKFAQKKPSFPPPFSTGTRVDHTSFLESKD